MAEKRHEDDEGKYTIEEVFPEYVGKDKQIALRAYRHREAYGDET